MPMRMVAKGGHQQNNGGNGGDAPDKGRHQAAEEGIFDQGQGHGHKDPEAVCAHVVGGFLNGLVDLPQGGNAAAGAGGQRAHHKDDDQDPGGAVKPLQNPRMEQAAGEAPDVAHAQNGAGNGHGQHGHRHAHRQQKCEKTFFHRYSPFFGLSRSAAPRWD